MRANIGHCARCGNGHSAVEFEELEHPVADGDGTTWDYWAPCPNNSQPILLRVDAAPETA